MERSTVPYPARLVVGITCDVEDRRDKRGVIFAHHVSPAPYANAVVEAGALPVILPSMHETSAAELVAHLDAFVIAGGDFDIPPAFYGKPPSAKLGRVFEERSAFERALCEAALAARKPLLGVCGGMQLLNVVFGGSLFQDLEERAGTDVHEQPHDRRQPHHALRVEPTSLLEQLLGPGTHSVNSTHHQIIHEVGTGLSVSATAPDGVIEAVEAPDFPFVLGVQWHPELLATPEQLAVYKGLVAAATRASG